MTKRQFHSQKRNFDSFNSNEKENLPSIKKSNHSKFQPLSSSFQSTTVPNPSLSSSSPVHFKKSLRSYTISIALPGSIISNCQSLELKTYVAGQIARAAAIYQVDEIIIFNDTGHPMDQHDVLNDPHAFLAQILIYLECPQYLRKHFFPMHPSLQYAGLLNPLDLPAHVRSKEKCKFREGVVLETLPGSSLIHVGLTKPMLVDQEIPVKARVTVNMMEKQVVSRHLPWKEEGLYWGYKVRMCDSFHQVFTSLNSNGESSTSSSSSSSSSFASEYDLILGTSERGQPLSSTMIPSSFQHLLLVFGGVHGLEAAYESDTTFTKPLDQLFHHYINVCPHQGVRTIRTEEAILITLSTLQAFIPS